MKSRWQQPVIKKRIFRRCKIHKMRWRSRGSPVISIRFVRISRCPSWPCGQLGHRKLKLQPPSLAANERLKRLPRMFGQPSVTIGTVRTTARPFLSTRSAMDLNCQKRHYVPPRNSLVFHRVFVPADRCLVVGHFHQSQNKIVALCCHSTLEASSLRLSEQYRHAFFRRQRQHSELF